MNDANPPRQTLAQALRLAAATLDATTPPPALAGRIEAAVRAHPARHIALDAPADTTGGPAPETPDAPDARPARDARGGHDKRLAAAPGGTAPRTPAWRRHWAWSGTAAFGAMLVGSVLLMLRLPAVGDGEAAGGGATAQREAGFIPLLPPDAWPDETRGVGAASAWLVSTELPGERLAAMGLPYDPARAGETVRAELLMNASGTLLAVRLLY